jgi:hypothetical protein
MAIYIDGSFLKKGSTVNIVSDLVKDIEPDLGYGIFSIHYNIDNDIVSDVVTYNVTVTLRQLAVLTMIGKY